MTSQQLEQELSRRIERLRLARNVTQRQLAKRAGISARTIKRLENGEGVSLDTFLRVLLALDLAEHLKTLIPDPDIRPVERAKGQTKERQRARPKQDLPAAQPWTWDEEGHDD